MNLVVLDGFTLNPGDLSWDSLRALGDCVIYDRTAEPEIVGRAQDAEALLTNKTPVRAATLERLPNLRYIGVLATGYDVVDVEQASRRKILVTNIPEYGTRSVAQMTFALILELANRVGLHDEAVRQGQWRRSPDWSFCKAPTIELAGKTLGIIGFGRIGKAVSQIALAFGMDVLVTAGHRPDDLDYGVRWGSIDEVLAQSDIVSLHCPLRPSTRGLICSERIAQMKPSALLINTSRGPLIVEQDLADALHRGRLAGAGLDVLSSEPPAETNPLIGAPHCIVTPHMAWATQEARRRLLATAVGNLSAWLGGHPQNAVN
jgi:glycerate dehydrogenase